MAARLTDALAIWHGILLVTLCALVGTTAQDLDGSGCQAVKHAYGAKGYNKNDVPRQMIAGNLHDIM